MRKHAALALLSMMGATWFSLELYLHDETRGVGRLFSRDLACGRRPLGNSFPVEDKQAPVFVVTTIIKNERPNIREWIEYNKMAGVDLHIIYDNDSSDDVGDILDPYIRRGEVLFLPWPPRRMEMEDNAQKPDIDRDMRASYQTAMEMCDGSLGTTSSHHIQERCQQAAVIDAIQKARRLNAHWIGVFDVSDFVFPGDAAYRHSVVDVLRDKFDDVDVLEVQGFVFGTNGHMSRPARGDLDLFSSLAIESYTRRAPSESATGWDADEFDSFHFGRKSIVKPHTVTGIKGHLFEYSPSARVEKLPAENDFLLLNRYHYHSKAEAHAKAAENLDRLRAYDVERDALMSQVVDTRLRDRVLVPLREKLQQVHLDDPPLTSDDIEKDIFDFHPVGNKKPELIPDLCVAVLTCRRIGLARETISRFIRYMHQFEPAISYELVLVDNDSGKAQTHQIWNDFPLDKVTLFRSNEGLASGLNALLFGSCRAPYVLTIEDDWLARVENWRPDLPVIEMSMNVLKQDDKVLEVWLRGECGTNGSL
ncbi:hypothetical protein JCM24511_10221 [Saitozyma sp. JCM 24511]|nr:hypothetical protein JCM24511_10221 [Saitozyma sp. JCM 24511]